MVSESGLVTMIEFRWEPKPATIDGRIAPGNWRRQFGTIQDAPVVLGECAVDSLRGFVTTSSSRLTNSDNRRQIDGTATEMKLQSLISVGFSGATRRIRTDDLLITNQLLYQLS